MITVKHFTFSPFFENTYVLFDETKNCAIIDPGCYEQYEKEELVNFIENEGLKPVKLLNTHCHIDHVFGNKFIADKYNLQLEIHELDVPTLKWAESAAQAYGLDKYEPSPEPSFFFREGDVIELGNSKLEVLHTPGHALGHVVFVCQDQKFVINGDVLFQGSIGRTDFPGCSHSDLINSIKTKLFLLDDDFVVYTGHGQETTIGAEKKYNPFLH